MNAFKPAFRPAIRPAITSVFGGVYGVATWYDRVTGLVFPDVVITDFDEVIQWG
ncbi:MAG: hypothetical protein V7690_05335 [Shewanella sp.]|uniref:hypothetical protein n=1 Tax=Shewanella sp. TaxID=50422 RepID=UPI00300310AC